ncbi:MAG: CHASE domain-containing protein, partial [Pseudomonas sp.]
MDDESVVHLRAPWLPLLVTLSLMTILGALVGWQWQTLETSNQNEHEQRFSLAVDDIEQSINERMRAYEMVLRGLSGLMVGRDDVSVDDWQRAADQLQLQDRYRGIQAVSWSRYLLAGQLEGFQAQEQGAGRKDFRILPPGERDQYLVVDYISPLDWRNRRALGFDMITEPIRAQAIVQARNTGEAVLTAPLRLRQETEKDVQAGAILYLPVYRAGAPVATVEERTAAMLGTVAGTFRLHDLLQGVLGSRGELLQVELVDTADNGGSLLNGGFSAASRFQLTRTLSIYGRKWQLTVSSTPAYEQMLGNGRSTFSLWVGLLAAALLGLLVGGYLYLRERALANSQLLSERLREREERFRLVVEASPNAIVLVDSSGRIAMVNRQAELMFGYPRAELLGQSVEMLLPESLRAAHVGMRKGFQQAPEPRQMGGNRELFGQHRDGHSIPLEVGLSPLRSGEDVLVQAVIIDISERKAAEKRLREQAEQLALANRYKSEFLANMSHELRTPLNSILILSEQLKQNVVGNL